MDIAIIGSGNVGGALARSASRAGHAIALSSADRAEAEAVAAETGARMAGSAREAVTGARIVILAIPADAYAGIAEELGDALSGTVVIDLANRPTPDPEGATCTSHAEEFQALVPSARVVKAINTLFAARQADPFVAGMEADGFVAADDEEAKALVLEFVESLGQRPIDVGPLMMARTLEGMGWLHIQLAMQHGWTWQTAWKLIGPTTG